MYSTAPIKKNVPFEGFDRTLHSAHSDPNPPAVHHETKPEPGSKASDEEVAKSNASHLPPAFLERGEVFSAEEMTTRYTDEEWEGIIQETEKGVLVGEGRRYPLPQGGVGGEGFTKTIDHTLLKLDAKGNQFDDLCAEARVNKFAVWTRRHLSEGNNILTSVIDRLRPTTMGLEMRQRPQRQRHPRRQRDRLPRRHARPLNQSPRTP